MRRCACSCWAFRPCSCRRGCPHWGCPEVHGAFGADLDRWLHFGGYPGAYSLSGDEPSWGAYVRDSLIETTLAHYLQLLGSAFLLAGLEKFRGGMPREEFFSADLPAILK